MKKSKLSKLFIIFGIINIMLLSSPHKVYGDTKNVDDNIVLLNNEAEVECNTLFSEELKTDLKNILKIMRIVAPLAVILLTTFELIGAIVSKDQDALNAAVGKLIKRLALVVVLFFLPVILNLLLSFLDAKYSTCIS